MDKCDEPRYLVFLIILGAVFLAIIIWNIYVSTYANWHWFDSKGHLDVYRRMLSLKWAMFIIGFLASLAIFSVNMIFAFRTMQGKSGDRTIALGLSVVLALMWGGLLTAFWNDWLLTKFQVASAVADPVFGKSISHYLFSLPWRIDIQSWISSLFSVPLLFVFIWYLARKIGQRVRKKKSGTSDSRSYEPI